MLWEDKLYQRLEALGPFPTLRQEEELKAWFMRTVPKSQWEGIAHWLPANMEAEIREGLNNLKDWRENPLFGLS